MANPDQSWRTRLMTYAFSLFNGVMPLGQNALGSSAGFKGNGMCFSTRGLRRRPWRSYGLVEDMEYSWTLRVAGEKILFRPEVAVYGAMLGSGGKAAANQRRRWEFGRSEIRQQVPWPAPRRRELGLGEKALSACELTIPSMGGWRSFTSSSRVWTSAAWFALAGTRYTVVRGLLLGVRRAVHRSRLSSYAISPFLAHAAPVAIPLEHHALSRSTWAGSCDLAGGPAASKWVRTARETRDREIADATATGRGHPLRIPSANLLI